MSAESATIEAPPAGTPNIPQPFQEAFSDLEGMATPPVDQPGEVSPPEDREQPGEVDRENEGKGQTPEAKPKSEDQKQEGEEKQKPQAKPQSKSAELRNAYEATKAKLRQAEADLAARTAELQTVKSKPVEDPEKKVLQERLTEREKQIQDLETKLRFTRYEESQEYKDKYYQPFVDAYQSGRKKAASLRTTDENGNVRQGTAEDFDRIVAADDDTAAEMAEELFGSKAPSVLYHRERVIELNEARAKAIEEFKKSGSEQEKVVRQQMEAHQKKMAEMFTTMATQAVEKYPELFKPIDGDQKGNELLQKGFELADAVFSGKDKDGNPIPPDKLVAMHAAFRNRAAGFARMVHLYRSLQTKVKALESDLKKYVSSEPGRGDADGKGKSQTGGAESWETELEKLGRPPV